MAVKAPKRKAKTLSTPNIIKDVVTPGIGDCPPKKLKIDLNYYLDIEDKYKKEDFENVLSSHYGQYLLIKDIVSNLFDSFNNFNHGTSYGRPWSNYDFYSIKYKTKDFGKCNLFFRVDRKKDYYYSYISPRINIRKYS